VKRTRTETVEVMGNVESLSTWLMGNHNSGFVEFHS
jgi:hypothetical protein